MNLFKLKGVVQNYAWGGTEFIPNLLSESPKGEKCAEYWMGAHDKAPAILEGSDQKLNEWIADDSKQVLGTNVHNRFGRLPFLFKVLDVHDILSIQVHPSKAEAEKGFAKENNEGIALSAHNRNYKDDNHKPEIMVALGEFWLLHGFKKEEELKKTLLETPELFHLLSVFESGGYLGLYQSVMEEPIEKTNSVLKPLINRILPLYQSERLAKSSPEYWAAKAFLTFCPQGNLDKGIYSIFFFNIVKVQAGEAVFQDAGVPHAYMEGQNIELMANSDNVLRGGLTPKHVDVPELLKHIEFTETIPNILSGEIQKDGLERIYKSPAPDFELSKIDINTDQEYRSQSTTLEIMIVLDGAVEVAESDAKIKAVKGEVFAVAADSDYQIVAGGKAQLYKAKCPA